MEQFAPDSFRWPPIAPERAREAIERSRTYNGFLVIQPSQFLTIDERDAVRAWFARKGDGASTFNSTLHAIAKADIGKKEMPS